ncbi:NACHT domain-containing protein [Bacillus thuringiensis]|uniref:NACHT domain-containing protein n=1 Tax=Bacillus thuringiensis TaxID=1428 RepID=UPI0020CF038A|nr:NACHT domain-containing protein [Bacillus thuringiensis]MED3352785.1 NACHT domain-containing protein [Bacillus thuringiensis]
MSTLELTKVGAPIASQFIKPLIDDWLKPKLVKWNSKKELNEKLEDSIYDNFYEYLKTAYNEFQTVNLIALGNEQIKIGDIYQGLTLVTSEKEEYKIDGYNSELVEKYEKILIEDVAGMGKSTLMKKMFIASIEENRGLPIFIELKKMEEKSLIDIIVENLSMINKEVEKEFILELINRGDFIFFLDGYDEIPFEIQQKATEELKAFFQKTSKNIFFMTSRHEQGLTSFGQFKKTKIKPLRKDETFSLIEKIDNVTKINLAQDLIEKIHNVLSNNSNNRQFEDLQKFLEVPLLATLVYITFRHKRDLASKKDEFYEKVYNALYQDHDLSKDYLVRKKKCNLSKTDFFQVLSNLGFLCLKENKIEFKESDLLSLIKQAINNVYGIEKEIKPDDVLYDLTKSIGLFLQFGVYFKWTHKSFMEYFAAVYVKNNQSEDILKNILNSQRFESYLNFLDIYHDIDMKTFDKVLLLPILNDYIAYMNEDKSISDNDLKSLFYNTIFRIEAEEKINFNENRHKLLVKEVEESLGVNGLNLVALNFWINKKPFGIMKLVENNKFYMLFSILENKNKSILKKKLRTSPIPELHGRLLLSRFNMMNLNSIEMEALKIVIANNYIFDFELVKSYKKQIESNKNTTQGFSVEGF